MSDVLDFHVLESNPVGGGVDVGRSSMKKTKKKRSKKHNSDGEGDKMEAKNKISEEIKKRMEKYKRGDAVKIKNVKNKRLKGEMKHTEDQILNATEQAARAEILLTQDSGHLEPEGMEKTWRFKQEDLRTEVDVRTQKKMFKINLTQFGPYCCDFSREGRYLLLGGRKGHISLMEWQKFALKTEIHVRETIKDICFLHNHTMFAVAQKKAVFIYDNSGIELHNLPNHSDPNRLAFLPYHFLLASVGRTGHLKYQDTSTGEIIAEHRTRLGECDAMVQNPHNAILCLGHKNGTVTMWSPTMSQPLIKMLCHRGPIRDLVVTPNGQYMATSGLDGQVKIWDLRTYKEMHSYYSVRPASTMSISQNNMLAMGFGSHVHIWKDAFTVKQKDPYMVHEIPGHIANRVRFCPYEDILGANPFATTKQQRESLVHRLLEKLSPDMIAIDSHLVGKVDAAPRAVLASERFEEEKRKRMEAKRNKKQKNKQRGRNSSSKRWRRKRSNVMDERTANRRAKISKIHTAREIERANEKRKAKGLPNDSLSRFKT
ncbi:hypothetical protein AAMO2058_001173000 [Amorphochlora amoebiformis]